MVKINKMLLAIILITTAVTAQMTNPNSFKLDAGIFMMTGDNTDNFETGYSVGFGYEHRYTENFGLEILPTASYIYNETEVAFFGVYVDTYVMGISLTPKFYIPVGTGGFQFVIAPRSSYSYVNNQVEVWMLNFYTSEEKTVKSSYSNGVFSFGGIAGFEVVVSEHLAIGLIASYDTLDLSGDFGEIDWAPGITYDDDIKTSRIGILSTFKFIF